VNPLIAVRDEGGVRTIRLNRPEKRNALTMAMYADLADILDDRDDDLAVVILTGTDGAFTSGNDLADMRANPPLGDSPAPVRFLRAVYALPSVLVAAVDGPAIGVGTTLLLHCDLAYATARSTFQLPFVGLGLVPEAASSLLLPARSGHARACELMLFGERFDAQAALGAGLLNEVLPDAAALQARVAERAAALAAKPRAALLATKSLLKDTTTGTVPERLELDRRVLQSLLIAATDKHRSPTGTQNQSPFS
jgi:enoyl-CoA hydratase/carnithine racemase